MADQTFKITLNLETECSEAVSEPEVKEWINEIFYGCDMGEVKVEKITEKGKNDDC